MQWEYKVIYRKTVDVDEFDELGEEEWELVAVDESHRFYFKRPLD
jgi:hypothetical protein